MGKIHDFRKICRTLPEDAVSILRRLNAKSRETYEHSVNVAFFVYDRLSQDPRFTKEEVKNWTVAALVHDAGKIRTPSSILHDPKHLSDRALRKMMDHSFEGAVFVKDLPRECLAAVIGHHIDAKAIKDPEFRGAGSSKPVWKRAYVSERTDMIQKLLQKRISWIHDDPKYVYALNTIASCDQMEAERTNKRHYHDSMEWGRDGKELTEKVPKTDANGNVCLDRNGKPIMVLKSLTIRGLSIDKVQNGITDRECEQFLHDEDYRKMVDSVLFDPIKEYPIPRYLSDIIKDDLHLPDRELAVRLSEFEMEEFDYG